LINIPGVKMSVIQRWMDFFLDAGIPDETAATYATNFSNNRYHN